MTKIWATLVAAIFVVFAVPAANASTIHSIDIVAQIQPDGSLVITDTRSFEATEGTEHYISLGNMGESEVHGFSVVLDGEPLTDVGQWDVDRSREDKAGQSAVVTLEDGYELAFGFGEYGAHTAQMTYTITNVVQNLEDGPQAIYWQFIAQDMTPTDAVTISITNAQGHEYSQDNTRIWGFGYEGTTAIGPAELSATTNTPIEPHNYMTLLVILDDAPFTPATSLPMTSAELEAQAKEDSIWEEERRAEAEAQEAELERQDAEDMETIKQELRDLVPSLVKFGAVVFAFAFGARYLVRVRRRDDAKAEAEERAAGLFAPGAAPTVGREDYWRDIPYDGDILDVAALYGKPLPNLATAYLLEWVRDGSLREVTHESGRIFTKEESAFEVGETPRIRSDIEGQYWDMISRAAREDGVLQREEIEQFTARHYGEVRAWSQAVERESGRRLESMGLMVMSERRELLGLSSRQVARVTSDGMNLKNRMAAFANYLRDFSLLNERSASNVALWDQYIVWAGFLGIADEVRDQFNIVDPSYESRSHLATTALHTARDLSHHMERSYTRTRDASRSSSSGGGGRSSSSGGAGARGGGRGGGIR